MIKRRNLLWMIPLALLVTFPLWKFPFATFLEPRGGYDPNFGKQDRNVQDFIMEKIVILQDQAGQKTAIVRADKAHTTETPNEFILIAVDADLFSEKGDQVHVVARKGTYSTENRELYLEKDVRVTRTTEGQKLFTDKLYYYDKTRKVHSPEKTRLVGKNIEVNGQSLDYDVATNQYKIGGRVICTIQDSKMP